MIPIGIGATFATLDYSLTLLSQRPGRDPAARRPAFVTTRFKRQTAWSRRPANIPMVGRLDSKYLLGMQRHRRTPVDEPERGVSANRRRAYASAMLDALNHLFGRNPFGRSYVTGIGYRPPMFPHDRRSGGDNIDCAVARLSGRRPLAHGRPTGTMSRTTIGPMRSRSTGTAR